MTLDTIASGQRVKIVEFTGDPALVQRLMEFGLMEGEIIELVGFAPLGDPLEIRCGQSRLSLRRREAQSVVVSPLD